MDYDGEEDEIISDRKDVSVSKSSYRYMVPYIFSCFVVEDDERISAEEKDNSSRILSFRVSSLSAPHVSLILTSSTPHDKNKMQEKSLMGWEMVSHSLAKVLTFLMHSCLAGRVVIRIPSSSVGTVPMYSSLHLFTHHCLNSTSPPSSPVLPNPSTNNGSNEPTGDLSPALFSIQYI